MSHARASSAPPHPFRAAPWYEPELEHRPCQCPSCRQGSTALGEPRLMVFRLLLVVLGGVALPVASLLVNAQLHVVELGTGGTVLVALSALATLANLVLYRRRRRRGDRTVLHSPPRSTVLLALLLLGALLGCLSWGYLALLFLPIAPLSVIAILFFGLGLCGLCPYGALSISIIQATHAARALAARIGRRAVLSLVLASLILPPLGAAALAVHAAAARRAVDRALDRIAQEAPHSARRMAAIAALSGEEDRLVERYLSSHTRQRQEVLAEAYLRLTDRTINQPVQDRLDRRGSRFTGQSLIRPWWFLEEGGQPLSRQLWRLR